MELYIGGKAQGKLENAMLNNGLILQESDFLSGETLGFCDINSVKGIYDFQEFVKKYIDRLSTETDIESFIGNLISENPDIVIVSDEIGSGIVPIDKGQRDYRDAYGKVMCKIAQNACRVTRVICGIGQVIKETNGLDD